MSDRYDALTGAQKRAWQQLEAYPAGSLIEAHDGFEQSVAFASAWPTPEPWAETGDPSQVVWMIPGDMEAHSSLELITEGDWLRPQAGRDESRRVRTVRRGYE